MTNENQSLFVRIGCAYYSFTASEKKVADFVLSNQDNAAYLSISELAASCGVAEATVSRFCRRLGCKGYNEFRLAAANAGQLRRPGEHILSGEITPEDSLKNICGKLLTAETNALSQTLEVLDLEAVARAVTMLKNAHRVLCMGLGSSMFTAAESAHLFSSITTKFIPVIDSHMQAIAAVQASAQDVILFFSYSGSTKAMLETIALARENLCGIILVTRFPNSPGARVADVVLQCGTNENPLHPGSAATRIAQLYLMDVVFSEYARQEMDEAILGRSRIAKALSEKHVF